MPGDNDFWSPVLWFDAQEAELKGKKIRILFNEVDIGVDSPDKGSDDLLTLGMIVIHFLLHVNAGFEETGADIPV